MASLPADPVDEKKQKEKRAMQFAAEVIRKTSEAARLLSQDEISRELINRGLLEPERDDAQSLLERIMEETLDENEDLVKLSTEGGAPRYYSSRFMSESYVRLLLRKEGDPLHLIATVVRENSATYPRPVPLNFFENSPFDLSEEEILTYLKQMARQEEFKDITQTTTSAGTSFLYSTLHLEPGYASMLAEWLDVGQANNP